jgi:hypothetical protein
MKTNYYYHSPFRERYLIDVNKNDIPIKLRRLHGSVTITINDVKSIRRVKEPRITVLGVYNEETESMVFTLAKCVASDRFVRKEGRKLCEEKYTKNQFEGGIFPVPTEQMATPGKYFLRIAKILEEDYFKKH